MADRRMGDRRTPDKGTINIKFKDAVIVIIVAVILIISIAINIILCIKNRQYKDKLELYETDFQSSIIDLDTEDSFESNVTQK